jgi:hypothetical protein
VTPASLDWIEKCRQRHLRVGFVIRYGLIRLNQQRLCSIMKNEGAEGVLENCSDRSANA